MIYSKEQSSLNYLHKTQTKKIAFYSNPFDDLDKPCLEQSQVNLGIIQISIFTNDFRGKVQIFKVNRPNHQA
jgi:hypothetical protein